MNSKNKRCEIEGKFGQAKSKYGLDHIKTRTQDTSYAHIGLILLAINLVKLGDVIFMLFLAACEYLWKLIRTLMGLLKAISDPKGKRGLKKSQMTLKIA